MRLDKLLVKVTAMRVEGSVKLTLHKSMVAHKRLITTMSVTEVREVVLHHLHETVEGDIVVIMKGEGLTVMSLLV